MEQTAWGISTTPLRNAIRHHHTLPVTLNRSLVSLWPIRANGWATPPLDWHRRQQTKQDGGGRTDLNYFAPAVRSDIRRMGNKHEWNLFVNCTLNEGKGPLAWPKYVHDIRHNCASLHSNKCRKPRTNAVLHAVTILHNDFMYFIPQLKITSERHASKCCIHSFFYIHF
ncbi:hypothetical protein TNIN_89511 [Trichonephila inaurata madagascariensis]|uniref:Uncharacterized protein n=1 Tax=Trichonephila inaurata madagascariensis TaxID=2747483 RepID=A0A8X7CRZ7_9ARAC|nr:hypothetical protein TNIN_89511 [Trichonephila inaurata madagascariensis]